MVRSCRAASSADFVVVPGHDGVAVRITADRHVATSGGCGLLPRSAIARHDPIALCVSTDRYIAPARRGLRDLRAALRGQLSLKAPALEAEADLPPVAVDDQGN